MSEAAQELEQEQEVEKEDVTNEVTEVIAEVPELPEGFQNREQWEESGKNPDDWRSPKTFADFNNLTEANKRLHQKVDHLSQSFNERLQGVNTLHQAQLKTQADKLLAEKKIAIDDEDAQKVDDINQELNGINQQQQQINQPQQNYLNEVAAYFNQTEANLATQYPAKAVDIKDKMSGILSRHTDPQAAANEFEAYAATLAPKTNTRRNEPTKTSTGGSKTKGKISMSDVTAEEKNERQWFNSDKAFLQAVQDVRGEKK